MTASILQRSKRAFARKASWQGLYDDIYEYVLPYRRTDVGQDGKKRISRLFDSTAVQAAFRFAGRMQAEITPPMTKWFEVTAGPLYPPKETDALVKLLEHDNKVFQAALDTGEFHTASMEKYQDLVAGTGVMFVLEADTDDELINYVTPPFSEVAIECSAKGHVSGVFWEKQYSAREIWDGWPQRRKKMPKAVKEGVKNNSTEKDHKVLQAITHEPKSADKSKRWKYELIIADEKKALVASHSRYSPAIVTRFFRLPGEDNGRGPAMIALPNIKTANKTVELILQAAALALFGIFTATDDGLLNPDKAMIEPGAIWTVESNSSGAYGGRSIEQLNLPNNFNISDIVLQDQRGQIKSAMMDDQLPPQAGAVRSPTEIIARQRNQGFDISISYGRINSEYIVKLLQRVHELLRKQNLLQPGYEIDQKMVMVKAVGPLAKSQNLAKIESLVQSLEVALGIGGMEMTALVFKIEEIIIEIAELMGVPPSLLRDKLDREKLLEMVAGIVAQSQEKADATGAPGPVDNVVGGVS